MQSLTHIQIFQNGIKEEGMSELIKSFGSNPHLHILKLNDNLIKNAGPALIEVIPSLSKLRVLDISDSLLGYEHSINLFKALTLLEDLKEIYCNYNEIEKKSAQRLIFEMCLSINNLEVVELKGNDIDPSLRKKFQKELRNKIKKFEPYSDEEEVFADEEEELADELEKLELNK
jgi:Ran GTPase-activating protein 1